MSSPLRAPTPDELSRLQRACSQSGRRSTVQIGGAFAYSDDYRVRPYLHTLHVRGEVPLKLYLTLLMMTRTEPHDLYRDTSAQSMALLLGLETPSAAPGPGTRRVQRALK